jgi:DNA repair protein RadC
MLSNPLYRQKLTVKYVEEPSFYYVGSINAAYEAYDFASLIWDKDEIGVAEQFYALYLNRQNQPITWAEIGRGGIAFCPVDVKIVMAHALQCAANGIILFHNHPSGNRTPSQADIDITNKIKAAGLIMDMQVLDHIIVFPNSHEYYSFADSGLIS